MREGTEEWAHSALWEREHGARFCVPLSVQLSLIDMSWKQDMCPSFLGVRNDGRGFTLWVDLPNKDEREYKEWGRFTITPSTLDGEALDDGPVFSTVQFESQDEVQRWLLENLDYRETTRLQERRIAHANERRCTKRV